MITKQLKLLFRNRIAILATISVPLVLTYLFSLSVSSNSGVKLYIADLDESVYSEELITLIKSHKDVNVITSSDEEIMKKVDAQEISMGLIIDKGFGEDLISGKTTGIKIIQNFENAETAILEQIINAEFSNLNKVLKDSTYISDELNADNDKLFSQLMMDIENSNNISIKDKTIINEQNHQDTTVRLIGFLAMFIWFVVIQGFRTLIDEKEDHTFSRLLSTPIYYTKHLITKIIATYIFGALHVIAILLVGKYILKADFANDIFSVGIIFAAYLFLLTGITAMFVLFTKSHQSFTVTSAIVITITGILGGSFFSLEIAPKYMQKISKFTPESWVIHSLKQIMLNSSSIGSQILPLVVFIVVGILGLVASIALMKSSLN